jgi:hypothetical protein
MVRRVPAVAAVALVMIGGLCPAAAQIAQSTYRLSRAPQFMLLELHAGSNLLGYTASIWDKKIKDIVVGRVVSTNTIELAFYLHRSKARRAVKRSRRRHASHRLCLSILPPNASSILLKLFVT